MVWKTFKYINLNGDRDSDDCLAPNYDICSGKFVLRREGVSRSFIIAGGTNLESKTKALHMEGAVFHEQIMNECKPFIDVDCTNLPENKSDEVMGNVHDAILKTILKIDPTPQAKLATQDIVLCTSSGFDITKQKYKHSYHL